MTPRPPTPPFAIWITGLPASGKSTITRALLPMLSARGVLPAVLESDELRKVFTPRPTYAADERDAFYGAMVFVGALLVNHGVPVVFDATAHRRAYRAAARDRIERVLEVFVDTPLALCVGRDPKGIYLKGAHGDASTVPGLQAVYEPPDDPDLTVPGTDAQTAAAAIVEALEQRGWLPPPESRRRPDEQA